MVLLKRHDVQYGTIFILGPTEKSLNLSLILGDGMRCNSYYHLKRATAVKLVSLFALFNTLDVL